LTGKIHQLRGIAVPSVSRQGLPPVSAKRGGSDPLLFELLADAPSLQYHSSQSPAPRPGRSDLPSRQPPLARFQQVAPSDPGKRFSATLQPRRVAVPAASAQ